jgi:hypothetical protein
MRMWLLRRFNLSFYGAVIYVGDPFVWFYKEKMDICRLMFSMDLHNLMSLTSNWLLRNLRILDAGVSKIASVILFWPYEFLFSFTVGYKT